MNFRDYSIFIKGIGFFVIDKVHNVDEFKRDFPIVYVFKYPISFKDSFCELGKMKLHLDKRKKCTQTIFT